MSSAVQFGSLPSDVPAAIPEGVFLVHNRACDPIHRDLLLKVARLFYL